MKVILPALLLLTCIGCFTLPPQVPPSCGGYSGAPITVECLSQCAKDSDCGAAAECILVPLVDAGFAGSACKPACRSVADCMEGQVCVSQIESGDPTGETSSMVCLPSCQSDTDCFHGLCDTQTHHCSANPHWCVALQDCPDSDLMCPTGTCGPPCTCNPGFEAVDCSGIPCQFSGACGENMFQCVPTEFCGEEPMLCSNGMVCGPNSRCPSTDGGSCTCQEGSFLMTCDGSPVTDGGCPTATCVCGPGGFEG